MTLTLLVLWTSWTLGCFVGAIPTIARAITETRRGRD